MDFILGIFTGAALMIFLGVYLNERNKAQQKGLSEFSLAMQKQIKFMEEIKRQIPLYEQMNAALQSENYEEAARLRDLINKR